MIPEYHHALIIGAGEGLSASLARLFRDKGLRLSLAARNASKLTTLCDQIGATAYACDASDASSVNALFEALDNTPGGAPDVVVYNPSARQRGPIAELDADAVLAALKITAYGGFLVSQQAVRRMLPQGQGAILFTGASASVKGYPQSAPFAMGKFALRGLAESLAREVQPQGIHVAHFVIDGAIRNPGRENPADKPDSLLDPQAIALTYWQTLKQDRSAWANEIALRPWLERF